MARNEKAGSINYEINIKAANAVRDLRNVQKTVRDLTSSMKQEALGMDFLGKHTEANVGRLKSLREQEDQLKASLEKNREVYKRYKNELPIEKQNLLRKKLNDVERQLYKNEMQQEKYTKKLTLFTTEIGNLSRASDSMRRADEQRVRMLQAVGRETDATKYKTQSYGQQIDLLTQKQKKQAQGLADYRNMVFTRASEQNGGNISSQELDKILIKDTDYQKAKSYLEKNKLDIASLKKEYSDLSSGFTEVKLKSDIYSKETDSLTNLVKTQTGTLSANVVELKRLSNQRKLDADLISLHQSKMNNIKATVGETSEAYKRARIEYEKMLTSASKNASREKELSSPSKKSSFVSEDTAAKMDKTSRSAERYDNLAQRAASSSRSLNMASLGVGAGFAVGARNAAKLEDKFNKIQVLMTTGGEKTKEVEENLGKLRKDSTDASIKYGVSQDKIVEGYKEMTKRGYDSSQVLGSQKYFLQAAIASGDDYNDVVNNGSSALEGFNLKGRNTKEAATNTKLAMNQLSYAADLTATDFNSMGYAMGYVASTAHSAGQNIGDTAGAIGVLSNNGVEASMAGTGLRKVLNSLSSPTSNASSALKQIGLSPEDFKDAKGNMLSIDKMMKIINGKTKDMPSADKLNIFHRIFGATGQEAALILAKNSDELGKLNGKISESQNQGKDGYIANIADRNMNTAEAQLRRLKESGKSLATSYAVTVLPLVNDVAKKAVNFTNGLTNASPLIKGAFAAIATGIPVFAGITLGISGVLKTISVFKSATNGLRTIFSWLTGSKKKQDTELEVQTKIYKKLTAAIQENTREKKINGSVDLSSGRSGSGGSSYGKSSKSSSTATRETQTVVGSSKNNKAVKEAETLTKGGKLKNAASKVSKLGYLGLGLDALNIGTDLMGGGKNVGRNVGSAVGGAAGMLVPIPGVDLAASLGLSYVGGKVGENVQNGKIPKALSNSTNKNIPNSSDNKKPKDVFEGKSDSEKMFMSQYGYDPKTGQSLLVNNNNAQNAKPKKPQGYDSLNKDDSSFLKSFVKQSQQATNDWASNTSKSADRVKKDYSEMYESASGYTKSKNSKDKQSYDFMVKQGLISKNAAKDAYNSSKKSNNDRLSNLKKTINNLSSTDVKGGKNRYKELSKVNREILSLTDTGGKKQKSILNKLNKDTGNISHEQYVKLLKQSKDAEKKTIDSATSKYKSEKDNSKKTLDDTTKTINGLNGLSESRKKAAIEEATEQYNKSVEQYKQQKEDSISWAKQQHEGVVKEATDQTDDIIGTFTGLGSKVDNIFSGISSANTSISKDVNKVSGKSLDKSLNNIDKATKIPSIKVPAYALGGKISGEGKALINEEGEESIYNKNKGTFNVVKGKPGLINLHSGDEVLNARQTKALLGSKPKRNKPNNAYANGIGGNFSDSKLPLTNKSKSVEMILKSLEFMFGNSNDSSSKSSSNSDAKLISSLMKSNEEKDKKIDNILDKMDILISSIQNKPVISEADIYKANKRQTQNQQRFSNLGKGAFS